MLFLDVVFTSIGAFSDSLKTPEDLKTMFIKYISCKHKTNNVNNVLGKVFIVFFVIIFIYENPVIKSV